MDTSETNLNIPSSQKFAFSFSPTAQCLISCFLKSHLVVICEEFIKNYLYPFIHIFNIIFTHLSVSKTLQFSSHETLKHIESMFLKFWVWSRIVHRLCFVPPSCGHSGTVPMFPTSSLGFKMSPPYWEADVSQHCTGGDEWRVKEQRCPTHLQHAEEPLCNEKMPQHDGSWVLPCMGSYMWWWCPRVFQYTIKYAAEWQTKKSPGQASNCHDSALKLWQNKEWMQTKCCG